MPAEPSRDDEGENEDDHRHSTYLNESDLRSADSDSMLDRTREIETDARRGRDRDTIDSHSDSLLGETLTLGGDGSTVIGNFRLISKLGSGGFGAVYKAEDLRLDRFVAIKALFPKKLARGGDHYKRVFHEGRAAAALDHPNIVSLYDVADLDGQFFIVSQLIDGVTLKEWAASGTPGFDRIAELIRTVARAVEYAHRKGVIHRDLKPGNILMDGDGVPYVNDFGIAKHSDADETITDENSIVGTPAYMSPEQASGRSGEADRRSDVYSLGVILFELMTGEKPFRGNSRMLMHHVIHTEPPAPRMLNQTVPRDLETICLKCLEKDADRRYATCAELADELGRFLSGEPIQARPVSSVEQFIRRCRRHPTTTAITGGLIAAIVIGLVATTWQWRRAESSRKQEFEARIEVEKSQQELAAEIAHSNQMLHDAESKLAFASALAGDHRHAKRTLDQLAPLGDIEYALLKNIENRYQELYRHIEAISDLAVSDDEQYIAGAGLRTLLVWHTDTGRIVYRHRMRGQQLRRVGFQPGGHLLAWGGESGEVHLKRIDQADEPLRRLRFGEPINVIQFSETEDRLLVAGEKGTLAIYDLDQDTPVYTKKGSSFAIAGADFDSANRVLLADEGGRIRLYDPERDDVSEFYRIERDKFVSLDVCIETDRFVAASRIGPVVIGSTTDPKSTRFYQHGDGPALDVSIWNKHDVLVAAAIFGVLHVVDTDTMDRGNYHPYFQGRGQFAIAGQSDRILIGGGDGSVTAVRMNSRPEMVHTSWGDILDLKFVGGTLVVCHAKGPASLIDIESGDVLTRIPSRSDSEPPASMTSVDHAEVADKLVLGTSDGRVTVWDFATARARVHGGGGEKAISRIRVSDDARWAISGGVDGAVRRWDLTRADADEILLAVGGVIRGIDVSPDQTAAVAVSANGVAVLIDLQTGESLRRIDLRQPLHCVAWSPDSDAIAIGGNRGAVMIYSADLSVELDRIDAHNGLINDLEFAPSGNRVVTIGADHDLTFSNLVTGRAGASLDKIHGASLRELALSEDGEWLATADSTGKIRIWDARK